MPWIHLPDNNPPPQQFQNYGQPPVVIDAKLLKTLMKSNDKKEKEKKTEPKPLDGEWFFVQKQKVKTYTLAEIFGWVSILGPITTLGYFLLLKYMFGVLFR